LLWGQVSLQQELQHQGHCCWVRLLQDRYRWEVLLLLRGQQIPQAVILPPDGMVVLEEGPQHQVLPRQHLCLLRHLCLQPAQLRLVLCPVLLQPFQLRLILCPVLLQLCDQLQQVLLCCHALAVLHLVRLGHRRAC
jgi:hypothetical protein